MKAGVCQTAGMIERVRQMRALTAAALGEVLVPPLEGRSEQDLAQAIATRLRARPELASVGWYAPPSDGVIVAVGNPPDYTRVGLGTYRLQQAWPRPDLLVQQESMLGVYASPVGLDGVIGDLYTTLYCGSNPVIRQHLRAVWHLTHRIAEQIEVGMTFAQVHAQALALIEQHGYANAIYSVHDGLQTNLGHSIPWVAADDPISQEQQHVLACADAGAIADAVSNARRFVSAVETSTVVTPDRVFTVEPRLSAPGLPTVCFHLVVGWSQGRQVIDTAMEPLLRAWGMDDILDS